MRPPAWPGPDSAAPRTRRQVAILTGSAQNIGRATALALAEGGAKVVANTRASMDLAEGVAKEIRDAGGEAVAIQGDITREDDVQKLVEQAVATFGRVDILVNNAAVRLRSPLAEITFAEWRKVVAIILDGAFLCARRGRGRRPDQGAGL